MADVGEKALFFFSVLHSIKYGNEGRNTVKVGAAHYSGICSAAVILLKERNIEMCGQQSLVYLLMFAFHAGRMITLNVCRHKAAT